MADQIEPDTTTWRVNEAEGTALGPVISAGWATLQAVWDDVDGMQVTVDLDQDDAALTANQARYLAHALLRLADTPPPTAH